MTDAEKRKLVADVTKKLLSKLGDDMKWLEEHGIGVTILAFTFEPGAIAYISTSDRADMMRALKEFVAYQDAGLTTEPPGERGRG